MNDGATSDDFSPWGTPAFETPYLGNRPHSKNQGFKGNFFTPFTTYCTTPSLNYHGFMGLADPGLGLEVEIVFDYD